MARKLMKTLLSAVLSAALMIGATAITAYAVGNAESQCSHDEYILDVCYYTYADLGDYHDVSGWEERYCRNCREYCNVWVHFTEQHYYNNADVCGYCEHRK